MCGTETLDREEVVAGRRRRRRHDLAFYLIKMAKNLLRVIIQVVIVKFCFEILVLLHSRS